MEVGRGLDWSLGRLGLAAICALAGLAIVTPEVAPQEPAAEGSVRDGSRSVAGAPTPTGGLEPTLPPE